MLAARLIILSFLIFFTWLYVCKMIGWFRCWLVSSSKDRTCRVWHVSTGECVASAVGHADAVGTVVLSQSTSSYVSRSVCMISGSLDKTIKKWLLPIHKIESSLRQGNVNDVNAVRKDSHKTEIAHMALKVAHSVRAHDKDINCVALSPNDSLLASASQDKSIRLWQTSDMTPLATLNGHKRGVWRVVFSPVEKCIASCSGDRTVRLWSVVDYSCLRTLEGHTSSVLAVKFINHGQQLVSGSSDGLIRLWTIRSGECEGTIAVANDEHILSGGSDSKLIIWKDATEEEERSRIALAEKNLLAEQQMQNDIRNKRYGKVLCFSLLPFIDPSHV